MELEIGKKQGHVIIDDNTGKIMTVMVKDGVKGKFDFMSFTSYKREGKKHFDIREQNKESQFNFKQNDEMKTMIAPMDPQLEKQIKSGQLRFKFK